MRAVLEDTLVPEQPFLPSLQRWFKGGIETLDLGYPRRRVRSLRRGRRRSARTRVWLPYAERLVADLVLPHPGDGVLPHPGDGVTGATSYLSAPNDPARP